MAMLFWASLIVAGCGGDTDDGNNGAGATGGSGGSATGGSSGSTGGSSGSTGGSSGSTGGSSGSAGSGGGGAAGTVSCGSVADPTKECGPQEYCCSSSCVSDGTQCTGYAFHCDDAADCPGAFCCADKLSTLDGGTQVAQCQASCDADTELVVCNHLSSDAGCPSGMTCMITATLPPQYGYCCPSGKPCSAT